MNTPTSTSVTTANKAQPHPLLNKVTNFVGSALAAPKVAYYGIKGAAEGFQADKKLADRNFKNRSDNTNYYKGIEYWKSHSN